MTKKEKKSDRGLNKPFTIDDDCDYYYDNACDYHYDD